MDELKIDQQRPIEIELKANSPAVFRFLAQYRVPGRDYVDFATAKDAISTTSSGYTIRLPSPILPYTDLRIYLLVDGPANHLQRIRVQCSQQGQPLGQPIVCEGMTGQDGKVLFKTAEATFV